MRATVSDIARIPDDSIFGDPELTLQAVETAAAVLRAKRKTELVDYMLPYVNALDEIMARFRAGLATV